MGVCRGKRRRGFGSGWALDLQGNCPVAGCIGIDLRAPDPLKNRIDTPWAADPATGLDPDWPKLHNANPRKPMMFNASCTSCGAINKTPLHYEGISIKCGSCGHKFVAVDPKESLFKFHRSSCGGRIEAKEKYRGTLAPCPHCEKVVPVGDYTMSTRPLQEPEVDPETAPVITSAPTSKLRRLIRKIFG